jgi:hypothetical protein
VRTAKAVGPVQNFVLDIVQKLPPGDQYRTDGWRSAQWLAWALAYEKRQAEEARAAGTEEPKTDLQALAYLADEAFHGETPPEVDPKAVKRMYDPIAALAKKRLIEAIKDSTPGNPWCARALPVVTDEEDDDESGQDLDGAGDSDGALAEVTRPEVLYLMPKKVMAKINELVRELRMPSYRIGHRAIETYHTLQMGTFEDGVVKRKSSREEFHVVLTRECASRLGLTTAPPQEPRRRK